MKRRGLYAFVFGVVALTLVRPAAAQTPPLMPRVAITDEGNGAALTLLDATGTLPIPVAVRLEGRDPSSAVLEPQISAIERRRLPLWLAVAAPATSESVEPWRRAVAAIVNRRPSMLVVLEVVVDDQPLDVATYAIQVAATDTRARHGNVRIAIGGDALSDQTRRISIYTAALAPYVDLAIVTRAAVAALL